MMKTKKMNTKENRVYVAPMCSIFIMVDEPLMAGSEGNTPSPVEPPSGETGNPNPAKQYNNTSVWDED